MVDPKVLFICFLSLLTFSLGRLSGRVEASMLYNKKLKDLLEAIKKVEQLASLRGEDVSKLSSDEILYRAKKQLELKHDE